MDREGQLIKLIASGKSGRDIKEQFSETFYDEVFGVVYPVFGRDSKKITTKALTYLFGRAGGIDLDRNIHRQIATETSVFMYKLIDTDTIEKSKTATPYRFARVRDDAYFFEALKHSVKMFREPSEYDKAPEQVKNLSRVQTIILELYGYEMHSVSEIEKFLKVDATFVRNNIAVARNAVLRTAAPVEKKEHAQEKPIKEEAVENKCVQEEPAVGVLAQESVEDVLEQEVVEEKVAAAAKENDCRFEPLDATPVNAVPETTVEIEAEAMRAAAESAEVAEESAIGLAALKAAAELSAMNDKEPVKAAETEPDDVDDDYEFEDFDDDTDEDTDNVIVQVSAMRREDNKNSVVTALANLLGKAFPSLSGTMRRGVIYVAGCVVLVAIVASVFAAMISNGGFSSASRNTASNNSANASSESASSEAEQTQASTAANSTTTKAEKTTASDSNSAASSNTSNTSGNSSNSGNNNNSKSNTSTTTKNETTTETTDEKQTETPAEETDSDDSSSDSKDSDSSTDSDSTDSDSTDSDSSKDFDSKDSDDSTDSDNSSTDSDNSKDSDSTDSDSTDSDSSKDSDSDEGSGNKDSDGSSTDSDDSKDSSDSGDSSDSNSSGDSTDK